MTQTALRAVIFDMDGVILDSEHLVQQCWRKAAQQMHLTGIDEVYRAQVGTTRAHASALLRQAYGQDFSTQDFLAASRTFFYESLGAEGVPPRPFAKEALESCHALGLRVGLASSTRQEAVETELKHAGLLHLFDHVLGGDKIENSKPAPDIYLAACSALEVEPAQALAVEDSYNGIRSAHSAGMLSVMVPDMLPPTAEMSRLTNAILPNLSYLHAFLQTR